MHLMAELQDQRREGRKEGREEGRKEGREEGITNTAVNMLKENIPVEIIARVTNLSADKILSLK